AGTITVTGSVSYNTGTLTYTSGTVTTTGSTLTVAASATLDTNGITWSSVTMSGDGTYTLSSDLTLNGTLSLGASTNVTTINGSNIHDGGSLTFAGTTGNTAGTTPIVLNGTGTWSATGPCSGGGGIRNDLTIDTAGTITISGTVCYNTGTLTYTSGTVTTTSSTLNVAASTTLDTDGIGWNNVTLSGTSTDTLSSDLTVNGTLTVSGITTFGGSGGLVLGSASTWAGSSAVSLRGSLTLGSGMTRTYTGDLTFTSTSGTTTITPNGTSLASALTFNGVGGTWQLGGDLITTGAVTLTNGTLDADGKNLTAASFSSANGNTRVITMGDGTWTLTGTGTVWDTSTTTGLSLTPDASTVKIDDASSAGKTFSGGGMTYDTLQLTGAGTGAFTIAGNNTFTTFTLDTPPHVLDFTGGTTNTACTWNLSGTAGNVNTVTSTDTTAYTLVSSCPGTSTVDYVTASYLTVTPAGSLILGPNFVDNGNNSGLVASGHRSQHPEDATASTPTPTPTPAPSPTPEATPTPTPTPTFTPMPPGTYTPVESTSTPAQYGLHEGQTISAVGSNDPDVYIVNQYGYKRLFLNPIIFSFYGHLGGFKDVTPVVPTTRDSFVTSGLFRNCETDDQAVYAVEVTGEDTGTLHHVAMTGDQAAAEDPGFFQKVFCINTHEFNWYPKGTDYTDLSQVPVYQR
ncbi:MAG TPA: hypothetical protein VMJ72_03135, partial [Candidatus Paceibacterota bacterium]|nr:hypothetical protein [Candidatus Paceibacterota bacterium]